MFNKSRKYGLMPIAVNIGVSAAGLIVCWLLISFAGTPVPATLLIGAAVCAAAEAGVVIAYRFFSLSAQVMSDEMNPQMGNMTLDLMIRLDLPVLILDDGGRVVWYNREFASRTGSKSVLYGKKFESFSPVPLSEVIAASLPDAKGEGQADAAPADGCIIETFGAFFAVKAYPTRSEESDFTITVWQDESDLIACRRLIEDEDTVVAYITIDNLEELLQYAQEKSRSAAAEVESILKDWADSVDGVFKEYERDRFIFLFASKYMQQFTEGKFDILDRVRQVRVGEGSLPVTVSIGISQLGDTLRDKERNAHAALDTALQRGGDQVVVRMQGDNLVYGGRSQSPQKRTKVRARVFAEQLAGMISSSGNVLIMSHLRPDFDAIGSSIGVARLCFYCGVPVNVVADLSGPDFIKCRERLSALDEYGGGIFVDASEAQDMLRSDTLLIICDVNNIKQFQAPDLARNAARIVVIDHHRKPEDEQDYLPEVAYIEPAASSASELVAEVLEHCLPDGTLTREEADLLLSGIMLDTKRFMRNTGSRTFGAALWLRQEGANPALAQELFSTDLDDLMSEATFESNAIIYRGCIAIANGDAGKAGSAARTSAAKAADRLLTVEGVSASFVVCAIDDTIHISARSAGQVNVQLILEKLGGGGHFDAAATQLRDVTVKQALEQLRAAIDEYLG
ncbi:MAG: DHH family phosphoesterase [Clostridia bacterium]|nr:DHH family phosphoesterase [Clostridia bacterium]